jgi:Putative porin
LRTLSGLLSILLLLLFCGRQARAQSNLNTGNPGQPTTIANAPQRDTNANKSNNNKWKDYQAAVTYQRLGSAQVYTPDASLHSFQHEPFAQYPWYQDMGNLGSPVNNLLFTPEPGVGPTLGYHVFDLYRYQVDSLNYYSTTRAYSDFTYHLGSKLEQIASIMHTQNVRPNWNVAVGYRKTSSPGYYKIQRNNHDNAWLTTNYLSLNKHYSFYGAVVYNKEQHDENGGVPIDSELLSPSYTDRRTVDVAYQNDLYSLTRSSVFNVQRDFAVMLRQAYTWGRLDTTYNKDSTQYTYHLIPRFSISDRMEISSEKHYFKDLTPDSLRYTTLFQQGFGSNGSSYYTAGEDSVFTQQKWLWFDNRIMLNGFLGREARQLKFSAGLGTRFDEFISTPVRTLRLDSLPDTVYTNGKDRNNYFSNYLAGEIKKEALQPGQWEYGANGLFYLTGAYAGDFDLHVLLGKQLKNIGSFVAGFQQSLNDAPYSNTHYENTYTRLNWNFNKESVTDVYAAINVQWLKLTAGIKSYVIDNYIYINQNELPAQYTIPLTLTQAWLRKTFHIGCFYLDNELAYQQYPIAAPINVPTLMGRHQLTYERDLFHSALKIVAGAEIRYHTAYYVPGYDALLNKYFYQHTSYVGNAPQAALFFNFRIKRFRAFVMGDQLQQVLSKNFLTNVGTPVINFNGTGANYIPVYAAPNAMIRFGFSWVMIN